MIIVFLAAILVLKTNNQKKKLTNVKYIFKNNFIYLFLTVLDPGCCAGLSLVEERGGYSLTVVHGLLIAVVSLVVEHKL